MATTHSTPVCESFDEPVTEHSGIGRPCGKCGGLFYRRQGEAQWAFFLRKTGGSECARKMRSRLSNKEKIRRDVAADEEACGSCNFLHEGEWGKHCRPCAGGSEYRRAARPLWTSHTFRPDIDAPCPAIGGCL